MSINKKSPEEFRKEIAGEIAYGALPFHSSLEGNVQMLVFPKFGSETLGDSLFEQAQELTYIAKKELEFNLSFIVTEGRVTTTDGGRFCYKVEPLIEREGTSQGELMQIVQRATVLLAKRLTRRGDCEAIISRGGCTVFCLKP